MKIYFKYFSLMAILALAFSLTSCDKEVTPEITTEEVFESSESFKLEIPEDMSEEDAVKWIENLSYDDVKATASKIDDGEMDSRYCYSYAPTRYNTTVSCWGCANPRAKHTYYYRQNQRCCYYNAYTRKTVCYWNVRYYSTYSCSTYC